MFHDLDLGPNDQEYIYSYFPYTMKSHSDFDLDSCFCFVFKHFLGNCSHKQRI